MCNVGMLICGCVLALVRPCSAAYCMKSVPVVEANLVHFAFQHLCNEMLSWMVEIHTTDHLISDSNCNIVHN